MGLFSKYPAEYSAVQVALKLLVTRQWVIKLCREGKFPGAYQDGNGQWWIPESGLKHYKEHK